MKNNPSPPLIPANPSEHDIRVYAYHLYEQGNRAPGHDLENWFEAAAFLKSVHPAEPARRRQHLHIGAPIVHAVQTPVTSTS
jgi:hypothetical protein